MKKRVYEILKLILCLLLFFFIGKISKSILNILNIDLMNNNRGMVIYQFILSLFLLIVYCVAYFKTIKKDFKEIKTETKKNIIYIIKMFFLFMIVKFVVNYITVLIVVILGFDTSTLTSANQNIIETYLKTYPLLMFFSTALFAPFYEEILFRLGFKKAIKNKFLFIIISGFIFGILHVFPLDDGVELLLGITQSISYVTMGIFLSYLYQKKDNIFISIGVHFLNNFLSVLAMLNM